MASQGVWKFEDSLERATSVSKVWLDTTGVCNSPFSKDGIYFLFLAKNKKIWLYLILPVTSPCLAKTLVIYGRLWSFMDHCGRVDKGTMIHVEIIVPQECDMTKPRLAFLRSAGVAWPMWSSWSVWSRILPWRRGPSPFSHRHPIYRVMVLRVWFGDPAFSRSFWGQEFYTAERAKELIPFATAWMELESIMLSEISQVVRDKYYMIWPGT